MPGRRRVAVRRRYPVRRRTVIPRRNLGYTRTQGYYGRYNRRPTMGGELKFFDTHTADVTVADTMKIIPVNLIGQGTGQSERIGRKIKIQTLMVRGTIRRPAGILANGTAAPHMDVRIMIVLDTQANGTQFSQNQLLDNTLGPNDVPLSLRYNNLDNSNRFRVIEDKRFIVGAQTMTNIDPTLSSTTTMTQFAPLSFDMNDFRCNCDVVFDSTTGAITEVRSNNLYACIMTNAATANYTIDTRVRFRG